MTDQNQTDPTDVPVGPFSMFGNNVHNEVLKIFGAVIHRLVTKAPISDDERRDLHAALGDAAEALSTGHAPVSDNYAGKSDAELLAMARDGDAGAKARLGL